MDDKLRQNCREINQFLADEERKIAKKKGFRLTYFSSRWGFKNENNHTYYFTTTSPQTTNVIRAGSGRRRVNADGTPYVRPPEFPEGGDPRFRAVLAKMLTLHISKSHDYGTGGDIYANYRASEAIDVPAWKSCFIRALEKVQRLTNAFGGKKLNHESVSDSFLDLANHIVISKVLYDEAQAEEAKNSCCGGNCDIC